MRTRLVLVGLAAAVVQLLGGVAQARPAGPHIRPDSLDNGGRPCATSRGDAPDLGYLGNDLEAIGADPSLDPVSGQLDFTFAIWPTADPSVITSIAYSAYQDPARAYATVPASALVSGAEYAWHVRVGDAGGTSPWSRTCYYRYDDIAPSAPAVTSTNFPPDVRGPAGVPADFVFDGQGDRDVVGFEYAWDDLPVPGCSYDGPLNELECPALFSDTTYFVRATTPGGTARLSLNPPGPAVDTLVVAAVDAAGNESAPVSYQIFVPFDGPRIRIAQHPSCGNRVAVELSPGPGVHGVLSYTYSVADGAPTTVTAGPDGRARIVVPVQSDTLRVNATSRSTNGFVSPSNAVFAAVHPQPDVFGDVYAEGIGPSGGVGVTGTFTVYPPASATAFDYRFDHGPTATVPIDPGTQSAAISFTPSTAGTHTLYVTATEGGLPSSCTTTYSFVVAG